ncbi:MAG: ABC transporter substrate-binding protein [Bacteroidia bacterium]|nr:ABC transporter substrate-binding protein [Bacteroidia bacterium]
MINVRVGGVPEHFNLAWHLAIELGWFKQKGINIIWNDVPGGTGAMCKALQDNEYDIAIALTEGVVSEIMQGNPSRVVQFYVNSPLRWGIFVNAKSNINTIAQMQGNKYAISRYKSGSHLMAAVNANNHNLTINNDDYVLVGNLDGARKALADNTAQLFMWEKFTTKPYVDNGEFKQIGECSTPWPCFVVAATDTFIANNEKVLNDILSIVNLSCLTLKNNSDAPKLIAQRYGIKEADALQWFKELEYAYQPEMSETEWQNILTKLCKFDIINSMPLLEDICYRRNIVLA